MAGNVTISALSATEPGGERILGPLSIQGSTVIGETLAVALSTGDNTYAVPTGAVGVIIIPPTLGTAAILYRTSSNSGDAGLPLSPTQPYVHTFPSPIPAAIILNAGAGQAAPTTLWFW